MEEPRKEFSPEEIASIVRENEALREENAGLKERLTYDSNTGLLRTEDEGRQTILRKIETIHGQGKKVCLLRLDVNGLKDLNEASSHEEVDEIFFPDLGKRLLELTGEQDGVAMRYHGDELGILVPLDDVSDMTKADSLVHRLDNFYVKTPGGEKRFTFTIGIAHEDEPEVKEKIGKLDNKEGELSEEGNLFTALCKVADQRERQAERKKKKERNG
ncbi:MAG TPA: diguanylate cyclase [Patescibacteria group bacterium]|nr:diguanylate cyclase [Patescibacteria group bacterium]